MKKLFGKNLIGLVLILAPALCFANGNDVGSVELNPSASCIEVISKHSNSGVSFTQIDSCKSISNEYALDCVKVIAEESSLANAISFTQIDSCTSISNANALACVKSIATKSRNAEAASFIEIDFCSEL